MKKILFRTILPVLLICWGTFILTTMNSCGSDTNTDNANNQNGSSDPRKQIAQPQLLLSVGYTTMHPSAYRPLGNNPIPDGYTSTDLFHAYDNVGFTNKLVFNRNLNLDDDLLDDNILNTIKTFYKNYKIANNFTNDDYSYICVFGITRIHNFDPATAMG